MANTAAPGSTRFLINGEPTDNRLGIATRGVYRVRLRATGRAAHSSLPELGESAIDKLLDALIALRSVDWPEDPVLGRSFYSVGLINGGVAPNVISPHADAELMFRTVGDHADLHRAIESRVGAMVAVEDVLVVPPVRLTTVPGIDSAVFCLHHGHSLARSLGRAASSGPRVSDCAHTSDEYCDIDELLRARDIYADLATRLLA